MMALAINANGSSLEKRVPFGLFDFEQRTTYSEIIFISFDNGMQPMGGKPRKPVDPGRPQGGNNPVHEAMQGIGSGNPLMVMSNGVPASDVNGGNMMIDQALDAVLAGDMDISDVITLVELMVEIED